MCSKKLTTTSIENYWNNLKRLKEALENADAIVIGAGAGLSTSAGHSYTGERFLKYFADFPPITFVLRNINIVPNKTIIINQIENESIIRSKAIIINDVWKIVGRD